jgi:hypothetical protein
VPAAGDADDIGQLVDVVDAVGDQEDLHPRLLLSAEKGQEAVEIERRDALEDPSR